MADDTVNVRFMVDDVDAAVDFYITQRWEGRSREPITATGNCISIFGR